MKNTNCYKVELYYDFEPLIYYFANRGLAELAINWAYENRIEELKSKCLQEHIEPNGFSGGLQDDHNATLKLVWWKTTSKGYVCKKEYFSLSKETIEFPQIIDS